MKFVPLVLKSLFRKKTRSILTLFAILLPLFVICIMGTVLKTLDSDPTGGKGLFRLIVRHKVSITNWLPLSYYEKIAQVPGVTHVVKMNWFGGAYIDQSAKNQFQRFSVDMKTLLDVFDEVTIVQGSREELLADRTGFLAGEVLVKKYGWQLGKKITLKGDIYPINVELTLRGVFKGPDETGLYFHHETLEEALPRIKGFVGWYWIKAGSPEAAQKIPPVIDAMFENSAEPTRTETEKESMNGFISMLGNVKLMITSICLAIVFVILLIAANTMAMAARERVTEIAVLRTLGFQKSTILGLILGESIVLALFAGLLGVGVFALLFPAFKAFLKTSAMGGFAAGMQLFPEVLAVGFGVAVFVGLVSGIVPAIRSAQRSITDGLRQVA